MVKSKRWYVLAVCWLVGFFDDYDQFLMGYKKRKKKKGSRDRDQTKDPY